MKTSRIAFIAAAILASATVYAGDRTGSSSVRPSRRQREQESQTYTFAVFRGTHYDDVDGLGLGFFPMHRNVSGAEIGLVGMALDGDLHGFGWGTLYSVIEGELHGGQFAMLASIADKPSNGFQIAAVTCMAKGMTGLQFSLFNNDAIDMHGLQLSAIHNLNRGVSTGVQVGLVNRAERFKGLQFGAINIAGEFEGVQIGICNYSAESSVPFLPLLRASF